MSIIEEKIKRNKEWFDTEEPSSNHFDNFRQKLAERFPDRQTPSAGKNLFLKIAAALVIIIVITTIVFRTGYNRQSYASLAMAETNLPSELTELKQYYSTVKKEKINIIDGYSCSENEDCNELKDKAKEEIDHLEKSTMELEKELEISNNNGKVMSAIVNNYQLMTKFLDNVIVNLSKTNN